MSLYLRGQTWWVKFQHDGQTIRRSSGTCSKREAQKFERNLRSEYIDRSKCNVVSSKTYADALLKWIKSGAPESMIRQARVTREYIRDDTPIQLLVPAAHDMKQAMIEQGKRPATVNRKLAVVRRILNVAFREWDWIDQPLGQKIQLLSEKGTEREVYLTKQEVIDLVGLIEDETVKRIVLIAAYTGLRQGEIRRLKPENWKAPYIYLSAKTKGKKPRTVPVVEDLHSIMESTDFNVSEWTIRKHFEKAREAMNRPDIHFHDLRHTFASWLVSNPNVSITAVRDILGHSNLSVTSKYAHLRPQDLDPVNDALKPEVGTVKGTKKEQKNYDS